MSIAALTAAVLAGGLYAGFELRKRRLGTQRNPIAPMKEKKSAILKLEQIMERWESDLHPETE